jgi:hypothetical protein
VDPRQKAEAVEASIKTLLDGAKAIVEKAKSENRDMRPDEKHEADSKLNEVERLKPELKSARAAAAEADRLAGKTGKATGWKSVADALAKAGDGPQPRSWEGRLGDVFGKAVDADDQLADATREQPGIRPLLEDRRSFAALLDQSDPGTALHIETTSVLSRGLAAGSAAVERDPLSTDAKAVMDLVVSIDQADLRQFAITSGDVPNAAFRSVAGLSGILAASLGRELALSLDDHALAALETSTPDVVSGGSSMVEKIRYAIADLRGRGVAGRIICVISDADAVALDLALPDTLPDRFPYGAEIVALPGLSAGEGYALADGAMHLFKGAARLDVDPFTSFTTNQSDMRLEFEALATVQEPSAIIAFAAGS